MPSTFSTNLKIELIGTGEQVGTWGTTTNNNFGTALEQAIVGRVTVTFATDANKTLTLTDTNAAQDARALFLNVTSGVSLTVTRDLIVPAINKNYIVKNATTGSQSIRVIVAGVGVTIPNGKTALIYNDGTDVGYQFDHAGALNLAGALVVGGTSTLNGNTAVTGTISSTGAATFGGNTDVTGTISSTGAATFGGNTAVTGTISSTGAATFGGNTAVTGTISSTGAATFGGNTAITGTLSATGDGTFSGTGQVKLPAGTTGQRSGSPVDGMIRYNSSLGSFEGYAAGQWGGIGGAQAGGAIMTNKDVASVSYTIATGENGLSVGPVTIDTGVTITVETNQRWLIL